MRRNKFKTRRKFERLEDRRLMAADIYFNQTTGILTIDGNSYADVAEVRVDGNDVEVELDGTEDDGTGTYSKSHDESIQDVNRIVFNGFAGNDTLRVFVNSAQADVLRAEGIELEFNGEAGNDILDNNDPLGGIKTTANGGLNNDTLEGSRFDDTFDGGSGHDIMTGYLGNDMYEFSGSNFGSDEVHEADNVDTDTLDFSGYQRSVYVNLDKVFDPNAIAPHTAYAVWTFNYGQIKLFNPNGLENVTGTAYDDHLRGNSRPNYLKGGGLDDTLEGRGGNDILDGQGGSDIYEFAGTTLGTDEIIEAATADNDGLRFSGMSTGLVIDLRMYGSNYAVDEADLKLKLANDTAIERVWGTDHEDVIIGNSRNNRIYGRKGFDWIYGEGGADYLDGGADTDHIFSDALDEVYGGLGWDYIDYNNEAAYSNPNPARYRDWGVH